MRVRLAGVAVLAVLAAGCGGGGSGSSSDADSIVPTSALAFATIDTDTSSAQVSSALKILHKFPIEPRAEQQLRASIKQSGVDFDALTSSAGSELDIAAINVNGQPQAVGLAKPSDEQGVRRAARQDVDAAHDDEGLDGLLGQAGDAGRVQEQSSSSIADDATYQAAIKSLPSDAVLRFYASPAAETAVLNAAKQQNLPSAVAREASHCAVAHGCADVARRSVQARGAREGGEHAGAFQAQPAGKQDPVRGDRRARPQRRRRDEIAARGHAGSSCRLIGQQLGVDLPALISVLDGPVIAYVRPGIPLPEVTIAAQPAQPQNAAKAIGGLLARFASGVKAVPTPVDGGTLDKLDLGPVALYYGVNGGQLVVTDSSNAIAELNGSVGRLTGDAVFKEAKDGAGMTDSAQTFIFLDIKDALPALSGFAQLANQNLPPQVENNLRPLRSALLFGSSDNQVGSFVVYVKTS